MANGQARLRIEIDEQNAPVALRKSVTEVQAGGGFRDTALWLAIAMMVVMEERQAGKSTYMLRENYALCQSATSFVLDRRPMQTRSDDERDSTRYTVRMNNAAPESAGFSFHPILKPFANAFATTLAGILGWRLLAPQELAEILGQRTKSDRVALASVALARSHQNVTFSFERSISELVHGTTDHHRLVSIHAQQLIGHSWELLKANGLVPEGHDEMFEFFRHVRNGCFHGNRFHFTGKEPKHSAVWRGISIVRELSGSPIFRGNAGEDQYFLNWGDPLLLLNDISANLR